MTFKRIAVVFTMLVISGCSNITQEVSPVRPISGDEVCIIENPDVKSGFLQAFTGTLEAKGYKVKLLPADAVLTDCTVSSFYLAHWGWDLALYMSYAKIKVFRDGRQIGSVVYDAREGGVFDKFIRGDAKVRELVNLLFPRR